MPSRLAAETSPYLLQHAENPVDWYPWGAEALERAQLEDRPILLSIGYAACHWCHVMAHESFEDPATAAVMNANFVNIKVDREERPDLDSIYMQAVQAMTGHGGWPMTVFLTPAGEPFYGGTYFPPTDRHGMPSFTKVLHAVSDAYRNRRDSVHQSAAMVREIYRNAERGVSERGVSERGASERPEPWQTSDTSWNDEGENHAISAETLDIVYRGIAKEYDARHGGFGGAPKFPSTMVLDYLLRHWARTELPDALRMARDTFIHMARGGIYDQIGGGFSRYAVDGQWLVPHFEKMLYDNALLIRLGVHLTQATNDLPLRSTIRRVTEETITWLAREMTSSDGGWYASFDADSDGHEGKFYVWDEAELDALLGVDAAVVKAYYGVTAGGNFEGKNILHVPADPSAVAERFQMTPAALDDLITHARRTLYAARTTRMWPARDEKILAGWNGLALRGVSEAARAFSNDEYGAMAVRNGEFLAQVMVKDGRVFRSATRGVARIPGFLEDHAAVALGFLALFEQTRDIVWLRRAREIADTIDTWFWDESAGAWFDTAHDAEQLIARPRDITDNAIPSGTSLTIELGVRLAEYTEHSPYRDRAERVLRDLVPAAMRYPLAFGHLMGVAQYLLTTVCHGEYCDMPSPRALDIAKASHA